MSFITTCIFWIGFYILMAITGNDINWIGMIIIVLAVAFATPIKVVVDQWLKRTFNSQGSRPY